VEVTVPLTIVIKMLLGGVIARPIVGRLRGIVRTVVTLVKKVKLKLPKIADAGGGVGPVVEVDPVVLVLVVLLVVVPVLVPEVEVVVVAWAEIEATNNNATKVRTIVNEEEAIPSNNMQTFQEEEGKREGYRE